MLTIVRVELPLTWQGKEQKANIFEKRRKFSFTVKVSRFGILQKMGKERKKYFKAEMLLMEGELVKLKLIEELSKETW